MLFSNDGTSHAQISGVTLISATGTRTELVRGLVGYVLPGSSMTFAFGPERPTPAGVETIEVIVNGQKVTRSLPPGLSER